MQAWQQIVEEGGPHYTAEKYQVKPVLLDSQIAAGTFFSRARRGLTTGKLIANRYEILLKNETRIGRLMFEMNIVIKLRAISSPFNAFVICF